MPSSAEHNSIYNHTKQTLALFCYFQFTQKS